MGTKSNDTSWKSVNATKGISKAITLDGNYRTIAPEIIEGIKCRCDKNGVLQAIDDISIGNMVKIKNGPFADFICNVDDITNTGRVWVLIDILQQQIRAKIPISNLSKVD